MPNHVTNRLRIEGTSEQVQEIRTFLAGDTDQPLIDFNKLVPMPESLAGSVSGYCRFGMTELKDYMTKKVPIAGLLYAEVDGFCVTDDRKFFRTPVAGQTEVELCWAQTDADRESRGGYSSWYDWSVSKWGTKWNAYDQCEVDASTIQFSTAWSTPTGIWEALAQKFPNAELFFEWADEDIGNNTGAGYYHNGVGGLDYDAGGSLEAYERAFRLCGGEEYYRLVDGNYEYFDGDEEPISEEEMKAQVERDLAELAPPILRLTN